MIFKNKTLILYDQYDFVEAVFDNCKQAAIYLGMSHDSVKHNLQRKQKLRDGRKLMWVAV